MSVQSLEAAEIIEIWSQNDDSEHLSDDYEIRKISK